MSEITAFGPFEVGKLYVFEDVSRIPVLGQVTGVKGRFLVLSPAWHLGNFYANQNGLSDPYKREEGRICLFFSPTSDTYINVDETKRAWPWKWGIPPDECLSNLL